MNHHLWRRNGTYYFRLRVPAHLVEAVGKSVIQFSLKTTDGKVARRLRAAADAKLAKRFNELEPGQGIAKLATPQTGDAPQLVRDYVEATFREFMQRQVKDGPDNPEQLRDMKVEAERALVALGTPGNPYRDEWVALLTDRLTKSVDPSKELDAQKSLDLAELARRGLVELQRRKLEVYNDRFDRPFIDQLFNVTRPASATFGKLADQFLAEKREDARINRLAKKTVDKIASNVDLIRTIIGDRMMVADIGHEVVQRLRSTLFAAAGIAPNCHVLVAIGRATPLVDLDHDSLIAVVFFFGIRGMMAR